MYREPHELVLRKQIDHIDPAARGFIAASPFVVLATAHAGGADASPRGGPPGFVKVLDDHRLAFGDLSGNNRLDSLTNLLAQPDVGLLFLVPGLRETLRVNGRATLTTDPQVLEATSLEGTRPRAAVGIDVEECFIHCAKAFRRSRLWDPQAWLDAGLRPSAACALRDHLQLDVDPKVIEDDLEVAYRETLWEPGG
ncbi:MAG: MSMEG_1061 family FMN-dependent PPOX-type flavoprotein [Acidimicrobiales bacterium]